MSSNSTSQRENEANGSSIPSEVVTIRRGPAIAEELLDNLENMHFTDDTDGLEQTLTALDPTLQDAYMAFGIFDSTTISRCRRVVPNSVEEEEDSDSVWEDEEVAAVAVRPFSRLAADTVRRRSGVRRGSPSSSQPPAQVPTFKEHDDVERIARPSSSENDNAPVEPAAPLANSDRARAA
mmetsp:Transcript_24738/g.51344  ORF Transcript_24738/g.51344 Transcript_24738/m.51344 type:complete len:180 (+) Transcript_24738:196-735(+)|eukprot:CAMPEP_0171343244 /NCGR_PEP_ID=MMETSP0878-20121228/16622_1 /TAXON_ID=67004 /ORGANISM="Thalassiosira weissflogii, Strain CCMP1336" /LENGTH=179 /DNA_ID=CAMNT_0011846147 /DNA_START=116 /DNA_END=655 /DNA_ORIENTATION=-